MTSLRVLDSSIIPARSVHRAVTKPERIYTTRGEERRFERAAQEPEMRIWQIRVFGEMRIHTVNSPYFQIRPGVFGVFGSRISE